MTVRIFCTGSEPAAAPPARSPGPVRSSLRCGRPARRLARRSPGQTRRRLLAETTGAAMRTIVRWLSRADVYESFAEADDNAEAVVQARAQAQELRAELEEYKRLAEAREITPISFARMEKSLLARIGEAEGRAAELGTPPVLRGRVGPGAAAAWAALAEDGLAVKRDIIRTVAALELMPVGGGVRRSLGNPDHLKWTWKLGGASGK